MLFNYLIKNPYFLISETNDSKNEQMNESKLNTLSKEKIDQFIKDLDDKDR